MHIFVCRYYIIYYVLYVDTIYYIFCFSNVALLYYYYQEKIISRFSGIAPNSSATGEVENMVMYAGESVGLVKDIQTAGQIVRSLVEGAQNIIDHGLIGLIESSTNKMEKISVV